MGSHSRIPVRWAATVVVLAIASIAALTAPRFRIERSVDLLGAFERATTRARRISVVPVAVAGSRRRAVVTDRRWVELRSVPVFDGAVFRFSIAVGEQVWDRPGDGVMFRVRAKFGTRSKFVYGRYLDPKSRPSERQWVSAEVPLADALRGEIEIPSTVDLVLSAGPGPRGDKRHDAALWADLRVERTRWEWPSLGRPRRPNVVLISIDTLRADRVGATVAGRPVTPRIDGIGEEAIRFRRAYAPANHTLLSHMSLLTGLYPKTHGVTRGKDNAGKIGVQRLPGRRVTLAETLQAHGYATGGFAFKCVWLDGRFGFAQGFDRYVVGGRGGAGRNDADIFPWLEANHQNPFFLFVHYYDAHSDWTKLPYDAPDELLARAREGYSGDFDGCGPGACATQHLRKLDREGLPVPDRDVAFIRALYDAGVEATDREVGRLLDRLESLGVLDDTLIVITSDHGEEFREHGRFVHTQLYEEIARVPLLFRLPGSTRRSGEVYDPVMLLDVMPTVLDLLDIVPEAAMEGRSLQPLMRRQALEAKPILLAGSGTLGIVDWPWKLIRKGRRDELYNLETDPSETNDVGGTHGAELRRLRAQLDGWRNEPEEEGPAHPTASVVDTDEADIERLRALGYVD